MKKTFEVRFYLKEEFAKAVREDRSLKELEPLNKVLEDHGLGLHNQLDEFESFLQKLPAEQEWDKTYHDPDVNKFLKEMKDITVKTVSNPDKREYLSREFTIEPPEGVGPYKGNEANKIIKDLQKLSSLGIFGEGPRETVKGVRKVYKPKRHPGTTGKNPDILGRL